MEMGFNTTYYSKSHPTLVKGHKLHFLGKKPTTLTISSYTHTVKNNDSLCVQSSPGYKKKNPIRKFTAAHHCITLTNNSSELLDDIMDEILVSVISLTVCTQEIEGKAGENLQCLHALNSFKTVRLKKLSIKVVTTVSLRHIFNITAKMSPQNNIMATGHVSICWETTVYTPCISPWK